MCQTYASRNAKCVTCPHSAISSAQMRTSKPQVHSFHHVVILNALKCAPSKPKCVAQHIRKSQIHIWFTCKFQMHQMRACENQMLHHTHLKISSARFAALGNFGNFGCVKRTHLETPSALLARTRQFQVRKCALQNPKCILFIT